MSGFATVEQALHALRDGLPVLVLDDEERENEGDVVLAAETLTADWLGWTIRHTSGYLCAPMTNARADLLGLPLMVARNADPLRTAYTITVDAASGVTTGISAADRAHTLAVLADPTATADDLIRPGHVVPLRARDGGVLERGGHTEATVDLCRLAGLTPVGAIAELVNDDGTMMRTPEILALGDAANVPVITIAALTAWRRIHDRVAEVARTLLPTPQARFEVIGYLDRLTGAEHVLLISPHGLGSTEDPPLVRVHSECLTGDVFGSQRCDCGPQLERALTLIADRPGAVVYLRGHEGRGVGLLAKLQAYELQDRGLDTVDAQLELGLPVDGREYGAAAGILHAAGAPRIRLLTNNPRKVDGLVAATIDVASIEPLSIPPTATNVAYLRTKRDRLGHTLDIEHTTGTH
ncbi:MAG: 3,4-dihydroxy-2-butanone-4-phosphate synthase [Arachnia sp.]